MVTQKLPPSFHSCSLSKALPVLYWMSDLVQPKTVIQLNRREQISTAFCMDPGLTGGQYTTVKVCPDEYNF